MPLGDWVMQSPEVPGKSGTWTPPSAPDHYRRRREVTRDVETALKFNSAPLLSIALCRAHACLRQGCCGALREDHSLHEAVETGNLEAAALLVRQGPKELMRAACGGLYPLNKAIKGIRQRGDAKYRMAELLLQHGADPNLCTEAKLDSPLHQAAGEGSVHGVNLLLGFGADPNAKNSGLRTPLHSVCCLTHSPCSPQGAKEQIVVSLLRHGADPKAVDDCGRSPSDCIFQATDFISTFMSMGPGFDEGNRTREHLLRAEHLCIRLQFSLLRGRGESDSGLNVLPVGVFEAVSKFL